MLRSWLQLFRVPNLFTVPGDSLAGFLLAAGAASGGAALLDWRATLAVLASLCLYAAGLAINDIADLEEDRRDRPARPLPSGQIAVGLARNVSLALALIALVAMQAAAGRAGAWAFLALALCIGFYNYWAKHVPILGPLVMGACRGLNVMLGSVAFTGHILPVPVPVFAGGVLVALYIAAVTNLARHETHTASPPLARALPVLPILLGALLAYRFTGLIFVSLCTTIFAVTLVFVSAEIGRLFRPDAPPLPPVIGALIRALLPLQAALCLVFPTPHARLTAVCLAALLPVARIAGRHFYAS